MCMCVQIVSRRTIHPRVSPSMSHRVQSTLTAQRCTPQSCHTPKHRAACNQTAALGTQQTAIKRSVRLWKKTKLSSATAQERKQQHTHTHTAATKQKQSNERTSHGSTHLDRGSAVGALASTHSGRPGTCSHQSPNMAHIALRT